MPGDQFFQLRDLTTHSGPISQAIDILMAEVVVSPAFRLVSARLYFLLSAREHQVLFLIASRRHFTRFSRVKVHW